MVLWAGRVLLEAQPLGDYAHAVLCAWATHGWDAHAERPRGLLYLDGCLVDAPQAETGYASGRCRRSI